MTRWAWVLLGLAGGCARLSPGDVRGVAAPPPTQRAAGRVVVVRGFLDWYSTGMDRLTETLRADGFDATAFREDQWGELAEAFARGPRQPVVLVGFSYGADDVVAIARRMADAGRPVDLLVTIDPVTPGDVPTNVRRCVDFFEPNGFWDIFPWLRGVPLAADRGATPPENIDVRGRPDLDEPDTSHRTIAGNAKVHRAIVELVKGVTRLGK